MKFSLAVVFGLFSLSALANPQYQSFRNMISAEINSLKSVNANASRYSDGDATPACKRLYQNIYNKRTIRIVYALGYGDAGVDGNVVLDHFSSRALKDALTQRCTPDTYFCGFSADRRDPDLLRKAEVDSTGENNFIVEVKIIKGSISGDDRYNTAPENFERQRAVCHAATQTFHNEIANGADFVIYNGHSRDGGGPDFCPPVRKADHHVNYHWYQTNRPGIKGLTNAMKIAADSGKGNKVVAMFSCSSQKHFLRQLKAANGGAGLILTKRLATFKEMMMDSYAALDSLIAQRCEEGLEASFDSRGAAALFNMLGK